MAKTRRVEIPRLVRHAKYGKILHRKTVCHVHDENNESHVGDTVEIRECPPRSQAQALGAGAGRDQEPGGRHRGHACRGQDWMKKRASKLTGRREKQISSATESK